MKKILLSLILSCFLYSYAFAAATQVQTNHLEDSDANPIITFSSATAGNLLVSCIAIDKASGTITVTDGWTIIQKLEGSSVSGAIAYKVSAGGETSVQWLFTNHLFKAWVAEYSGLSDAPLDVSQLSTETTAASVSTGTTDATAQDNELAIALSTRDTSNDFTVTWSNSFGATYLQNVNDPIGTPGLAIATKNLTSTGTVETTASWNTSDEHWAAVATFKEEAAVTGRTRRFF